MPPLAKPTAVLTPKRIWGEKLTLRVIDWSISVEDWKGRAFIDVSLLRNVRCCWLFPVKGLATYKPCMVEFAICATLRLRLDPLGTWGC